MNHTETNINISSVAEKVHAVSNSKIAKKSETTEVKKASENKDARDSDNTEVEENHKETPKVEIAGSKLDSGFRFKVDPNHPSNQMVIEVLDKNGKVIKTIPSEEIKSMLEAMREGGAEDRGLVVDLKS